jgi:hypothetical protein
MSHRANLVVVEQGRVEVRPDRHGAQSTPNLVLGGPENCVEVMRLFDPGIPYSPVWCEGLIMADIDHRELLLSGGDYAWNIRHSPGLRRAVLPIIASRWPGWTVRWADGGAFDLAAGRTLARLGPRAAAGVLPRAVDAGRAGRGRGPPHAKPLGGGGGRDVSR